MNTDIEWINFNIVCIKLTNSMGIHSTEILIIPLEFDNPKCHRILNAIENHKNSEYSDSL